MKILVTGSKGQLGIDVVRALELEHDVVGHDSDTLDITEANAIMAFIRELKPQLIINCAAYTNVDGCEENVELAYKVNAIGPKNLAIAASETGARLLHISTDFVFDGRGTELLTEFDKPNPLSIYGKSKLAGEELIRAHCSRHYILRTAWLYGHNGNNFVKTMLKISNGGKVLTVVDDQFGTPTFTEDLVKAIQFIITTEAYGTYHATNNGQCSWNEFAKKIFELNGDTSVEVLPISTEALNRPAARPAFSVLKNFMFEAQFGYYFRNWEAALEEYFKG